METRGPTDLEVTTYLSFFQNMISRMNANSTQCKLGCITLCAALLAFYATAKISNSDTIFNIMLLIQFVFVLMDARYHAVEKNFRAQFDDVVKKYKDGTLLMQDLYKFSTTKTILCDKYFWKSLISWSVWPLYVMILALSIAVFVWSN